MQIIDGPDLSAADVYAIWQIRDVVFSVEQQCTEADVDGIDLLPSCTHLWLADAAGITSYLRTYVTDAGYRKIGRVCTRVDQRGRGLSAQLLRAAHERWGGEEIRIGAQAYLHDWYAGFGYVQTGPHYDEAGIDHIPMIRLAAS